MLPHQISIKQGQPEIIIIGGGAAGVAAFQRLYEKGFNKVKIIEAENTLGGRIKQVQLGDNIIDLGAHWVHGEKGNAVFELAGQSGLLENSEDFENLNFVFSDGSELKHDVGMLLFEQSMGLLSDKKTLSKSEGSVVDYIYTRCKPLLFQVLKNEVKLEAFLDWLISFECSIKGCDSLDDASAKGSALLKCCPGHPLITWKKGSYMNIIDILLKSVNKYKNPSEIENSIICNCEAVNVDWSGTSVLVKCKNGKVIVCDHAIVTVSLGVLKERGKHFFDPPLPDEKRKAIAGLGIGTVNKVYLLFPYQWWPKNYFGFNLLWCPGEKILRKGEFPWEINIIGFYAEKGAPNTLVAWLTGNSAREMENYSEEQVMTGCLRTLNKFLNFKYSIPQPIKLVRSTWYSNHHFRGSYSFRTLDSDNLDVAASDLAKPLKNHFGKEAVLFAGEATHSSYHSSVHGAVESGWREADRLAQIYQ